MDITINNGTSDVIIDIEDLISLLEDRVTIRKQNKDFEYAQECQEIISLLQKYLINQS